MASEVEGLESDQIKVALLDLPDVALLDKPKVDLKDLLDQQVDMLQGLAGLSLGREVGREARWEETGLALGRMEGEGEGRSVNVRGRWREDKTGRGRVMKEQGQEPSLHRVRREVCGQCGLEVGLKSHISRSVAAGRSRS